MSMNGERWRGEKEEFEGEGRVVETETTRVGDRG